VLGTSPTPPPDKRQVLDVYTRTPVLLTIRRSGAYRRAHAAVQY
jgi:hypothetical protein